MPLPLAGQDLAAGTAESYVQKEPPSPGKTTRREGRDLLPGLALAGVGAVLVVARNDPNLLETALGSQELGPVEGPHGFAGKGQLLPFDLLHGVSFFGQRRESAYD